MERPWLILGRVLIVDLLAGYDDDDLHAGADEHAGVGEAQADAQVQEEEEEEHVVAAVDAAAEAQDEQQQAAAGEAEEEDPLAQMAESVVNVNTDAAASEAAHGAGEPEFIIDLASPPLISFLFAEPGSHPDPQRPDMFAYIIATGRFCLLVHFAVAPFFGTNFHQQPNHSHLVVVRHFRRDDDDGAEIAARAVRVPDRPNDMPALSNIESVGLVCNQETGHYQIAELIVPTGDLEASVVCIRTDTGRAHVWQREYLNNPCFDENSSRDWVHHGTVTVNGGTVFWFDLSWGMISCDVADPHLFEQDLHYHRLPPGRVLRAGAGALPDIHCRRCIAVSENLVRYVEIILERNRAATTVNMWYRDLEANPCRWNENYTESFEDIWADESYKQTGLSRNIPMLVGVSPVNSSVVYFSLDQRLFGVNVPEHTVVHCEQYEPLNRPGPDDEPVTSRYLITWNLDADQAPNVGHRPDEPSDYGDSSPRGPLDEGEIDYQAPEE